MKKFLFFVIVIMTTITVEAQKGYWYHSEFIDLQPYPSTLVYVQARPNRYLSTKEISLNDIKDTCLGSMVSEDGNGVILETKGYDIDSSLFVSKIYSSVDSDTIIIVPYVIMKLKDGWAISPILEKYNNVLYYRDEQHGMIRLDCNVATSDEVLTIASELQNHFAVEWCAPGLKAKVTLCNPLYSQQYYLHNTGSGYDINVEAAWVTSNLSNITVAVIDDGVEHNHEDLSGCVLSGYTRGNSAGNGEPSDLGDGKLCHGTNCAGIIGAVDNTIGIKGTASGVKLLPVNLFPTGYVTLDMSDVATAIIWAGERADVINLSLSFPQHPAVECAINYIRTNGRSGKGVPVVSSAGNNYLNGDTLDVSFPASLDGVIAVGAIYQNGGIWPFSQGGPGLNLVAFGNLIVTTNCMHEPELSDLNYSYIFGGTSAATPQVSGTIALMLSANPDLTESEIKDILYQTCFKLPTYTYDSNGWNKDVGYGLVDAGAAVAASLFIDGPDIPTPTSIYSVSNLSSSCNTTWSFANASNVPLVQDLTSGEWCMINNSNKQYINDTLVATIYKGGNIIARVKKYINTGAHFSGTYAQASYVYPGWTYSGTSSTSFHSGENIDLMCGPTITLTSSAFSGATVTYSGSGVQNWTNSNGVITFNFKYLNPSNPFDPLNVQPQSVNAYSDIIITGKYTNSYETFQFRVIGMNPPSGPGYLSLDIISSGQEYLFALFGKNDDHIDKQAYKIPISGWTLTIANVTTGRIVYDGIVFNSAVSLNTAKWEKGIYAVMARYGKQEVTQKINIK